MTDLPPLRVHFATSEAAPLVKVGGLGDVAQALPKHLAERGHRVELFLPRYEGLPRGLAVAHGTAAAGRWSVDYVVADQGDYDGVRYFTVDADLPVPWSRPEGYVEANLPLFVLFSRALADLATRPEWRPDAVHCNDWHVGHLPLRLKELGAPTRSVMTIHNLAYQGLFDHDTATELGLGCHGSGNLLAQGIEHSDAVTTVSRRYRDETLTPLRGNGLDSLLRARRAVYHGVLNGVDYDQFTPATDAHLVARYDVDDLAGKALCKAELQRAEGLPEARDAPLVAFVGRLVKQKGVELILSAMDELAGTGCQFVFVGTGELYERAFARAAAHFHTCVAFRPDSGEAAARRAYAGSDVFLAPSEFEPCGLAPLIALRYGSVPIVRRVGGLAETIADTGYGFAFDEGTTDGLVSAVRAAAACRADRDTWEKLRDRGMRARFTWEKAARHYESLYAAAEPDATKG